MVDAEVDLLTHGGHQVDTYIPNSDDIVGNRTALAFAAVGPIWNPRAMRALTRLAKRRRPDIVHIHNTVPMISPSVTYWANREGLPIVQTLHNFRLDCANGLHYRDDIGKCTACLNSTLNVPAVTHRCYRDSLPLTLAVVAGMNVHNARETITRADHILVLNEVARRRLIGRGVDPDRVTVRPAWANRQRETPLRQKQVFYAGRLDEYKGVRTLLNGWRQSGLVGDGWKLVVAGSGPLEETVRSMRHMGVLYLGRLTRNQVAEHQAQSAVTAVPTTLLEGYPLVIAEAYAAGAYVLASTALACASSLDSSCTRLVGESVEDWAKALSSLRGAPFDAITIASIDTYERVHSPEVALKQLETAYRSVLNDC